MIMVYGGGGFCFALSTLLLEALKSWDRECVSSRPQRSSSVPYVRAHWISYLLSGVIATVDLFTSLVDQIEQTHNHKALPEFIGWDSL